MVESGAIPVLKRQLIIGTNSTAWRQLLVEEKSCFFVILPDWPYNEDLYCKTGQEREKPLQLSQAFIYNFYSSTTHGKNQFEKAVHTNQRERVLFQESVWHFFRKKGSHSIPPPVISAGCMCKLSLRREKLHSGCTDTVYSGARISTPLHTEIFISLVHDSLSHSPKINLHCRKE